MARFLRLGFDTELQAFKVYNGGKAWPYTDP